jgi:hypothetical protein
MGMSALYGAADEAESVATIQAALDAGVTLLDTGDYYGAGHNELLIRDALRGRDREDAVLSVKFGVLRSPSGEILGLDGRPAAVKNALGYTLTVWVPTTSMSTGLAASIREFQLRRRWARWRSSWRPGTFGTSVSPRRWSSLFSR